MPLACRGTRKLNLGTRKLFPYTFLKRTQDMYVNEGFAKSTT